MAEQLADHAEALAGGERTACIGVAEVVDAHVVEVRPGAQAIPVCGDGGEVSTRLLADDDPGVAPRPGDACQHGLRRGRKGDHAGPGLAVAEPELACGAVDIVPAQRQPKLALFSTDRA